MTDKLFEVPPEAWCDLRELYAKQKLYVSSFNTLEICVDWYRQNKEISKEIKIYSVDEKWKSDGTFVMWDEYQLIGNTLNADLERLRRTLELSKCFDVSETFVINAIRERVLPAAKGFFSKELKESGRIVPFELALFYHVKPEIIRKYDVTPPPGYSVSRLQFEHAAVVNSNWPHSSPATSRYVERLIRYNDSIGVFDQKGNLVAWCLLTTLGSLGLTQVLESHRRHGLGSLVVRCMAKKLLDRGIEVTAPVIAENRASRLMFEKLGFSIVDNIFWAYKNNETKGHQ